MCQNKSARKDLLISPYAMLHLQVQAHIAIQSWSVLFMYSKSLMWERAACVE